MGLTTFRFFTFAVLLVLVYYIAPKKYQWVVLLAASIFFYCLTGVKSGIYILITACSAYGGARWMERIGEKGKAYLKEHKAELSKDERKAYKNAYQTKRRRVMIAVLVLNFGLLCVFKYTNFAIEQINHILHLTGSETSLEALSLIIPLGISFYTFQTMGYLVDVYWEKVAAQKNIGKMLLFTSFFPQITQGPISDYRQLSSELFTEHSFNYHNFSWGAQRFLWGLAKKLILANTAATMVDQVFNNYQNYMGIATLMGAFCYSIQIYADFSGYMDMMCGLCEILGIHLTENFVRPYFSKSIAEYWRRWHISLGEWFKTYIYYPISVSKFSRKIGKKAQAKFGRRFGKDVPATIGLLVTWFTTGLWHGATWAYIIWGVVNGLFIIASLWMDPVYDRMKSALHVNESSFLWKLFITVRTFFLVTLIKVLPEVGGLRRGVGLIVHIFAQHSIPRHLHELVPFVSDWPAFYVMCLMTLVVFIFSMIQRQHQIRSYFNRIPAAVRIPVLAALFIFTLVFAAQVGGMNGDFLYAQF